MIFQKTEWYLFALAAFVVALVYYQAFDKILATGTTSVTSIFTKVMGQTNGGAFQKPF